MVVFFRFRNGFPASHSITTLRTSSSGGATGAVKRENSVSQTGEALECSWNTTSTTVPCHSPAPMTMEHREANRCALHSLVSPSRKLDTAKAHQIPCVTPGWVQQCVYAGRLLDISSPPLQPIPFTEECATTSTEVGPESSFPYPSSSLCGEGMTHSENKQGIEESCEAVLSFSPSSPSSPLFSLSSMDQESSVGPPAASFAVEVPSSEANVNEKKVRDLFFSTPSSSPSLEGMQTHPLPTVRTAAPPSLAPALLPSSDPLPWLSNAFYEENFEEVERGITHEKCTPNQEKHLLVSTKSKKKRKRKRKKGKKAGPLGMQSTVVPRHGPIMDKMNPTLLLSF